jgi:hypothetical protein
LFVLPQATQRSQQAVAKQQRFEIVSKFKPSGDQPQAIDKAWSSG